LFLNKYIIIYGEAWRTEVIHLHDYHHYRSAEMTVIQEMLNDARMTLATTQHEGQQVSKSETKNLEVGVIL
jgi:uncharacterized protein YjlB